MLEENIYYVSQEDLLVFKQVSQKITNVFPDYVLDILLFFRGTRVLF